MQYDVSITVDHRERASGIPDLLEERKANVSMVTPRVGGYIVNNWITVERKSAEDFVQSVINHRLFKQCSKLKSNSVCPLMIIGGNPYRTDHKITSSAVRGACLAVSISWQIPVMYSSSPAGTANRLMMAGQQLEKAAAGAPIQTAYKPKRQVTKQLRSLQGLPTVGPLLAKRLIEKFLDIQSVANAPIEQLKGVEGIGKKSAGSIRDFLTGK